MFRLNCFFGVMQALFFVICGILIITPLYSLIFPHTIRASILIVFVLGIVALIWLSIFNITFQQFRLQNHFFFEKVNCKSLNIIYAVAYELSLVCISLPVVMWLGPYALKKAILVDFTLTGIYIVYTYIYFCLINHRANFFHMVLFRQVKCSEPSEKFGVHLMLDGYNACPLLLANEKKLHELLNKIPRQLGMHLISEPIVLSVGSNNRRDPGGLSGFVMIAESHLSFHTFPRRRFISIDLFTCQMNLDTDLLVNQLVAEFKIGHSDVFVQVRGLQYPTRDID
jgi:S-adenosylmethionine decarboxylase